MKLKATCQNQIAKVWRYLKSEHCLVFCKIVFPQHLGFWRVQDLKDNPVLELDFATYTLFT